MDPLLANQDGVVIARAADGVALTTACVDECCGDDPPPIDCDCVQSLKQPILVAAQDFFWQGNGLSVPWNLIFRDRCIPPLMATTLIATWESTGSITEHPSLGSGTTSGTASGVVVAQAIGDGDVYSQTVQYNKTYDLTLTAHNGLSASVESQESEPFEARWRLPRELVIVQDGSVMPQLFACGAAHVGGGAHGPDDNAGALTRAPGWILRIGGWDTFPGGGGDFFWDSDGVFNIDDYSFATPDVFSVYCGGVPSGSYILDHTSFPFSDTWTVGVNHDYETFDEWSGSIKTTASVERVNPLDNPPHEPGVMSSGTTVVEATIFGTVIEDCNGPVGLAAPTVQRVTSVAEARALVRAIRRERREGFRRVMLARRQDPAVRAFVDGMGGCAGCGG